MKSVGIVGFGEFGRFLAEKLDPYYKVLVYSKSGKQNSWTASLPDVAQSDYVVLCVPLEAYEEVLLALKPHLSNSSTIVDVCSVKQVPIKIIRRILPGLKIAATHPLFGPQSADTLSEQLLVLCPDVSNPEALHDIEVFATSVDLKVKSMTAKEHDEEMATVQGLTFFIAHILKECGLHEKRLSTPSFKRLLSLAELEKHHSDELFYTIQAGNSSVKAVRQKFIELATKLDEVINKHKII